MDSSHLVQNLNEIIFYDQNLCEHLYFLFDQILHHKLHNQMNFFSHEQNLREKIYTEFLAPNFQQILSYTWYIFL